jgi:hypothetical protein
MEKDPKQYRNLISHPEYAGVLAELKEKLAAKLTKIQVNDLPNTK